MKKTIHTFIISICLTIAVTITAQGQAGSLDFNFGSGGIETTAVGSADDVVYSSAIQSDGKIVVAGYSFNGSNDDFALARYNSDGTLDNTFSSDGKVTTDFGNADDRGFSVAIESDDKIVVAGWSWNGSNSDFALVRYNNDGSLDNTFDSDGKVTTDFGSSNDDGGSVIIQSDGKIVVAGSSSLNFVDYDFALVRYNSNGSLDNTFDSDGKVTTAIGSGNDVGSSVALQSDGKIVVTGQSHNGTNYDFAVVRYNSNGSLDNTFDSDGKVTTDFASSDDYTRFSVAVQIDGKIVMGGYTYNGSDNDFALVRYNSDGSLDNTFDSDGKLTTAIGNSYDEGGSVAIQNDSKIIMAGFSYNDSDYDFALVRYNSDGSLDNSFGSDGKVTTDFGGSDDVGYSVNIQNDGQIVVAGYTHNGINNYFAVARYNAGFGVGIAENIAKENTLNISPNPFNDELSIKGTKEKGELMIFNVMGKEMIQQKTFDAETKINTEKLLSGFYLLNYINGNKTSKTKLVKF